MSQRFRLVVPCMSCLGSLYDALVSISAPSNQARAVVESLERDMLTFLATQSDIDALRKDMAIWLGSVQIIGMGLLFAALELTWRRAHP